ncbi:MAG: branched-chain amino acid ABC transporter permease [Actinomycetota bacterium]|nr:branched-chain amino acid ABC transporter permease [Actinomycetota bacterium]
MTRSLFIQSVVFGILSGGVYALLASGLSLYFGVMRIVQIAHPAFLFLGAYLTYSLHNRFDIDPLLTMPITVPLFFVTGMAIQRLLLARLRDENAAMMSVLLTFAIAVVVEGGLSAVYTGSYRSIDVEYAKKAFDWFGVRIPRDRVIGLVVAGATLMLLFAVLRYSRYGRSLRATMQHPEAARLVGVETERVRAIGFGIGMATAAVGGAVLSIITTFFPSGHWEWIARLMAIIVVGGLGSVGGAAVAAFVLGIIEAVVQSWLSPVWAGMVFYLFLFVTLIFRPQGFFGGRLAQRY